MNASTGFNPIELEIVWNRLFAAVDEAAVALLSAANASADARLICAR